MTARKQKRKQFHAAKMRAVLVFHHPNGEYEAIGLDGDLFSDHSLPRLLTESKRRYPGVRTHQVPRPKRSTQAA